jgi:hypothetical protein
MSYIRKAQGIEGVKLSEIRRFWVVLLASVPLATQGMAAKSSRQSTRLRPMEKEVP